MAGKRQYTRYVTPELWESVSQHNKDLIDKFIMGKRNLSDASKAAYTSDLQSFMVFILQNYQNQFLFDFSVEEAAEVVDDHISYSMSVLGNSKRRVARRTASISSLYIFYKKRRKIKENPVELIERIRATSGEYVADHVFLTSEQVALIRENLEKTDDTQLKLYFELSLFTMARVSAISSIRINQINLEKKIIIGVTEKEGRVVDFFISDKCRNLITQLLDERRASMQISDFLFCTKSGLNAKSLIQNSYVKTLGKYAGVKGLTAHSLRRTGSNLRRKAGMNLEDVSKLLNHKSTAITQQCYIEEDFAKLREEAEKFDI